MELPNIPAAKCNKRTALFTCRKCGFFQDQRSITLYIVAYHLETSQAPYHCLLCRARYVEFERLQVHIRSAGHRAHLMIATPEEASKTLGRGSWTLKTEGEDRDIDRWSKPASDRYWNAQKQAKGIEGEAVEIGLEDLVDRTEEAVIEEYPISLEPLDFHPGLLEDLPYPFSATMSPCGSGSYADLFGGKAKAPTEETVKQQPKNKPPAQAVREGDQVVATDTIADNSDAAADTAASKSDAAADTATNKSNATADTAADKSDVVADTAADKSKDGAVDTAADKSKDAVTDTVTVKTKDTAADKSKDADADRPNVAAADKPHVAATDSPGDVASGNIATSFRSTIKDVVDTAEDSGPASFVDTLGDILSVEIYTSDALLASTSKDPNVAPPAPVSEPDSTNVDQVVPKKVSKKVISPELVLQKLAAVLKKVPKTRTQPCSVRLQRLPETQRPWPSPSMLLTVGRLCASMVWQAISSSVDPLLARVADLEASQATRDDRMAALIDRLAGILEQRAPQSSPNSKSKDSPKDPKRRTSESRGHHSKSTSCNLKHSRRRSRSRNKSPKRCRTEEWHDPV